MNLMKMPILKFLSKKCLRNTGNYEKFATFENMAMKNVNLPGVTMVRNHFDAEKVIKVLYQNKRKFSQKNT